MTVIEGLGFAWLIFTAALGHVTVILPAYRDIKRTLSMARRGEEDELARLIAEAPPIKVYRS